MSLQRQCEQLGLALEVVKLERSAIGWIVNGVAHKRPEDAALAHLAAQGWVGVACEGAAVLMLMKAACLDHLARVNTFGSRADACTRYFEAQAMIHKDRAAGIIADIERADERTIRANLLEITSQPTLAVHYPPMKLEALVVVWRAITPALLARFAGHIFEDFGYRAGWPDLTVSLDGALVFVEVKTTDRLHRSQFDVIRGILQPSGAAVRVLQIKPAAS